MSTKIYNAYRIPLSCLNKATELLHISMRQKVQKQFNILAEDLMTDIPTLNPYQAGEKLLKLAQNAADSPYRSAFDFECGFRFWICDCELLVYLQFWGSENFIPNSLPEYFEDYYYQDSSDRPDQISEKDWEVRKQNWNRVCLNRFDEGRFSHCVMTKEGFGKLIFEFMKLYPVNKWKEEHRQEFRE